MLKKIFRYVAKKLRLCTGCDAPFVSTNAIEQSGHVYSMGFPSTEFVKKTFEIFAEYNRRKQPRTKAWWEDVHTMD